MIDISAFSSALRLDGEGIWYSPDDHAVSYPEHGHRDCLAIEEESFWFRHRNTCIAAAVRRFPPPMDGPIFDIGGGNGFVTAELSRVGFKVVLVEPGREGVRNGKRRGLSTVVCATLEAARFRPRSLPAIGLFDVIEHIEDDRAFLKSVAELLVPGGRLYATVPAYPVLWSDEDEIAGHFRRYTTRTIGAALASAGLRVDYRGYFFRFLPLPIAFLRAMPYRLGLHRRVRPPGTASNEHRVSPGFAAKAVKLLLASEASLISSGRSMRFGASCLLVAAIH